MCSSAPSDSGAAAAGTPSASQPGASQPVAARAVAFTPTTGTSVSSSDSLDLIDIVFTVTLGVGLTPEILEIQGVGGMLSQLWVKNWLAGNASFPTLQEQLHFCLFLIGVANLLFSWIGLHASLRSKPIRPGTVSGIFRFGLDVSLVLLYGIILIFFQQQVVVLNLLAIVYVLFLIWDVLKTIEYWDDFGNLSWGSAFQRQFVSFVFALLFVALALWFRNDSSFPWTAAFLALGLTISYRVAKIYPTLIGYVVPLILSVVAGTIAFKFID